MGSQPLVIIWIPKNYNKIKFKKNKTKVKQKTKQWVWISKAGKMLWVEDF